MKDIISKSLKVLIIVTIIFSLFACGNNTDNINGIDDLNDSNKTIGVWTGSIAYDLVSKRLNKINIAEYTDNILGYIAVQEGKIDAFAFERVQMQRAIDNGQSGVRLLEENIGETEVANAISPKSKIDDLKNKMNQFIKEERETIDEMYNRWVIDENVSMPNIDEASDPKYHLVVATTGLVEPYSFYSNNELTGFDIELAKRFALWLNAELEFKIYDYDSIIAAALSGDVDCIMANLNVTEERKEKIEFSDPLYIVETAVMVKDNNQSELVYNSISELENKKIGILTGTIYDGITKNIIKEADFQYYSTITDLTSALLSNKIEAFAEDESILKEIVKNNEDIGIIPEVISNVEVGVIFAKDEHGQKLRREFNAFMTNALESGLTDELYAKWENYTDETTMIDYENLPATNGTITMATSGMSFPFNFVLNNKIVGYEAELIALFCQEYGYNMQVMQMTFDGIISAVQSGKVDMAASGIGITEERSKQVDYSIPDQVIKGYFAVKTNTKTNNSFFANISDSFYRTFIKENRWKLFVEGIITTLLITVLSLIFGTILGFISYKIARNNFDGLFAKFVNFIIWLIHGMPTVVLLMILYYIIFGNTSIDGFIIAVIGFTLTFACSMFSMLKGGEKAIDKGQIEAAFTLGYNRSETFNKIVLPQAAYHFMPSYKAEIVSLIKATAVVGYIAVQDITKVGDIVRSRTYEAFFPLIVIAIMYFVMSALLTSIVNRIDFVIDPKKRDKNKILKGVKQHD